MSAGAMEVRQQKALSSAVSDGALTNPQLVFISNTEFIPKGLRGKTEAILACVATGRALGLADMTALRSIHIIDGKATFSAELMVMLARKAGHSITGEVSPTAAKVTGKRIDNGDTLSVEWTIEHAKEIGLLNKDNWKRYPEDMLWARAASALCRRLFADCFAGASYTPEELGAGDITADELMDEPAQDPEPTAGAPPPSSALDNPAEPEAEDAEFEPVETPTEITSEQKDRLLELVAAVSDKVPDIGGTLTAKIKADYGAKSYNDLNSVQMDELLGYLETQAAA